MQETLIKSLLKLDNEKRNEIKLDISEISNYNIKAVVLLP